MPDAKRPRLLLTGFGPFPGAPVNPTGPLIRAMARRLRREGIDVSTHIFTTSYASVDRGLPRLLKRVRPDALLMFGLANKARAIRVESRARNRISRFPDATFVVPKLREIDVNGPRHLPIRAPKAALLQAAKGAGLPARHSVNAGDYLCNYLYWHALVAAKKTGRGKTAFIHVPLPSPRFDFERLVESGLAIAHRMLAASHGALQHKRKKKAKSEV